MKNERICRVLDVLNSMDLSQMLVIDPMSIYYLTDVMVHPGERFWGLLLKANGEHVLFINKLFHIPENLPLKQVWYSDTEDVMSFVMKEMDSTKPLGVDKDLKARFLLPLIEKNAAKGFVNASFAVDFTRGVKDAEEQKKMCVASQINDAAMAQFKTLIHAGVSEKEVADKMLQIYLDLGADGFSFEPIVSFGANAADPHHMPDDTILKEGDCVLFDVGCIKDDYCSDMTRTFYYKFVSDTCREIYETTRAANAVAEAMIRPGVLLRDIDAAARDLITAQGYGENFTHRLGHFIGLDEHEYGDVSSVSSWMAQPGMIFSIEPGIYLSRNTGVRVEDLVLVTENGCEVLNKYSKELEIIE